MRLEISALCRLKSLTVGEDAVLDHDVGAVFEEVIHALGQRIGHVAHMALNFDVLQLIQNDSLHLHRLQGLVVAAIGAAHVLTHMLLAHQVVAGVGRAAHRVPQ